MPSYLYRCANCFAEHRVIHSYRDAPDVECTECGELLHKVPQPVRINWAGFTREYSPAVQAMIQDADRNRDIVAAAKERHVNQG